MTSRLPENCLLLYADLMQKMALHAPASGGAFVSKIIKGKTYWYHQTDTAAGRKQAYMGLESADLLAEIAERKGAMARHRELLAERRRLVAMLGVAGAHLEKGRVAKIIGKLSDAGLFNAGGVMVGSFAFACYGNMLGVKTASALSRTEDIDFSLARTIAVAFNRNMRDVLLDAEPELRTPIQINPRIIPFEMVTPDGFKVEFLTTKRAASDNAPVNIERFNVHAQPLEFMDYLLDEAQSAVVLNGAGILVTVPDPARFALHKLAVSQLRPIGLQAKIRKDIAQASVLLDILSQDNPGALILAMDAVFKRDDALPHYVCNGIARLDRSLREKVTEAYGRDIPVVTFDTKTGRYATHSKGSF
jgi:hypothetical protein